MLRKDMVFNQEAIVGMSELPAGSVDLILCDLPYGVTKNPEDKVIPLEKLWAEYKRILKPTGTIILTSQFPFTLDLINANRAWFRYDLIWDKVLTTGFLNANKMPLRVHEHLLVFYPKLGVYHPQKTQGQANHSKGKPKEYQNNNYGVYGFQDNKEALGCMKHPTSILRISKPHPSVAKHRTEKPVELADWLIKTYSNPGDLVLDNCCGAGWVLVSAKKNNRHYLGFDLNPDFCRIAGERLKQETSI